MKVVDGRALLRVAFAAPLVLQTRAFKQAIPVVRIHQIPHDDPADCGHCHFIQETINERF
jgi:hypothetical protein